jgi:hypothetical protein
MGILLGGPKSYRQHKCAGGITVFLEWFDPERDELGRGEPALIVARTDKFGLSGNRGCATIMLEAAYKYAGSVSGAPTETLVRFATRACIQLGLEPSKMNAKAIADAIVNYLPDLLRMPPAPNPNQFASQKAKPGIGEVALVADGKVVAEAVVD